MREVVTERVIVAPRDAVWAVIADLSRWPDWNPSMASLQGDGHLGARWRMGLRVGPWVLRVPVTVVRWAPGEAVAWIGGVPGLTRAEHGLRLEDHADGTRLIHTERFTGLLPHLLWPWLRRRLGPRYAATNEGLAAAVAGPVR